MDKVISEFLTIIMCGIFMFFFVWGIESAKSKTKPEVKEFLKKYWHYFIVGICVIGVLIGLNS